MTTEELRALLQVEEMNRARLRFNLTSACITGIHLEESVRACTEVRGLEYVEWPQQAAAAAAAPPWGRPIFAFDGRGGFMGSPVNPELPRAARVAAEADVVAMLEARHHAPPPG